MITELRRWLRSPKGNLTLLLCVFIAVAAPVVGTGRIVGQVVAAVLISIAIDLGVSLARRGTVARPDGGLITGLIVGMVLGPGAPLGVTVAAAGLAMASKHVLRVPQFHLFNPAAFGLLASLVVLPSGQSWWGALGDLPAPFLAIPLIGGALVARRVNRLPSVISFFGAYFAAFSLAAVVVGGTNPSLAAVFRPPFLNAAVFFGFLMLTDPATSPSRLADQLLFGAVTGIVSAAAFVTTHGLHYLFIGLLVANAWFAVQRTRVRAPLNPVPAQPTRFN
jgi:Na+-translocating ferredoxin:NAD+ oxidoreductase RnfD subunit